MTEERVGTRSKTRSRLETLMDILASVEDHPVKGITQIISEQNMTPMTA